MVTSVFGVRALKRAAMHRVVDDPTEAGGPRTNRALVQAYTVT